MNLSRATKQQKAEAILKSYITASEINRCVGNELTEDFEENQHNLAESEFKETILAIENNDLTELQDGICDLIYTVSECVMIQDRDTYLLKNAPKYLNEEELPVEQLIYQAYRDFREKNYVDALGAIEDAVDAVEGDIVTYLDNVDKSNLSKFPKVDGVDPEKEADWIESQGRYHDVYFEEGELFGEKVYVFKSTYDSKTGERFPKGKYIKPSCFKEPSEV